MLAKRVIPSVLVKGRFAVKGERFDATRNIGLALEKLRTYARRQPDELLLLDVTATREGRGPDLKLVQELAHGLFTPLTVGGGVRSIDDINALLRAGADKVAICTAAWEVLNLVEDAARRFGSQAIVVALDASQSHMIRIRNATQPIGYPAGVAAQKLEAMGAGEILINAWEYDGTMAGYDLDLIREVSQAVSVPVIASGGCSGYEDMLAAFQAGADACAAGALFAFTDSTPKGAAQFLRKQGMEVRL